MVSKVLCVSFLRAKNKYWKAGPSPRGYMPEKHSVGLENMRREARGESRSNIRPVTSCKSAAKTVC